MGEKDDHEVLADELAALGAQGAQGAGVKGGEIAARMGVQWVTSRLPDDSVELSGAVAGTLPAVMAQVTNFFNSQGKLLGMQQEPGSIEIRGVLKAGVMNLNPAVVTVWIVEPAPDQVAIRIRGVAKEGLIKQHAGEKAAQRVAQALFGVKP
jgi:hypothetical protein